MEIAVEKPILLRVTRNGHTSTVPFTRRYNYFVYDSNNYNSDLSAKWKVLRDWIECPSNAPVEKYAIGVEYGLADGEYMLEYDRYDLSLPVMSYTIRRGDTVSGDGWSFTVRDSADIDAVLHNMLTEYDLREC